MTSMRYILLISNLIHQSLSLSCESQVIQISGDLYSSIFTSDAIIFTNTDRISCVYKCSVYKEEILITRAVYYPEDCLCSCTSVPTTIYTGAGAGAGGAGAGVSGADGVRVHAVVLDRPGDVSRSIVMSCN